MQGLKSLKKTKFEHQQTGRDWSKEAWVLLFDPWQWKAMSVGDWFLVPDIWPPDKEILWEIDDPRYDRDFVLVRYNGKRYIERIQN